MESKYLMVEENGVLGIKEITTEKVLFPLDADYIFAHLMYTDSVNKQEILGAMFRNELIKNKLF